MADLPEGARLELEFLPPDVEAAILRLVRAGPGLEYNGGLARATRHYGARYTYAPRGLAAAPALPRWLALLAARVGLDPARTQCIANEYTSGQSIAAHRDDRRLFGERIAIVSMGLADRMVLRRAGRPPCLVELPRGSLLVLEGPARHVYTHEIHARKRGAPRVSLTLREMLPAPPRPGPPPDEDEADSGAACDWLAQKDDAVDAECLAEGVLELLEAIGGWSSGDDSPGI